jgi:hypothetical protein
MISGQFETILQELAQAFHISELHPDSNNSCKLKLKAGIEIQLELDRSGNFLIIGTDLGEVPVGRYRESLFREALKCNDLPAPNCGILAYSRATNHLVLFEKLFIKDLNGDKVFAEITPLVEKAKAWSEAMLKGELPVVSQVYSSEHRSSGMFGLHR